MQGVHSICSNELSLLYFIIQGSLFFLIEKFTPISEIKEAENVLSKPMLLHRTSRDCPALTIEEGTH